MPAYGKVRVVKFSSTTAKGNLHAFPDQVATGSLGSQVAIGQPRVDFITGTAGIGHELSVASLKESFAYLAQSA